MSNDRRRRTNELMTKAATIGAAVAGLPGTSAIGILVGYGIGAINKTNQKRVYELVDVALNGDDDDELMEEFSRAMLEEDAQVIDGFYQTARAAMNAVDPVVIPAIGLLFRRFMQPNVQPLPQWQVRQYLRFLEELTAIEFGDSRRLLHGALRAPALLGEPDRDAVPITYRRPSSNGWSEVVTDLVATPMDAQRVLCQLQSPGRIFAALLAHRLATVGGDDNGGLMIEFAMIRPLAELMPMPTE